MVAGALLLAGIVGYLCGAFGGLILTFYNNNFMDDTAQGSYFWWAKFGGFMIAVFAVVPGALAGLAFGLFKANSAAK